MNRRDFLKVLAGGSAASLLAPRIGLGGPQPNDVFWVHVQAVGAWDVALVTDPKAALRQKGLNRDLYLYGVTVAGPNGQPTYGSATIKPATSAVVRSTPGNGIQYLGFADFHGDPNNPNGAYKPFFPTYYDRITVFNGVDTGTINHSIGMRYCTAGSNNEHFPCFASQVASVRAPERPLSFMNLGGYSETAGLIAAQTLSGPGLANLLRVVAPNDLSGDNLGNDTIIAPTALDAIHKAHAARTTRLRDRLNLPSQRIALDAMQQADAGRSALSALRFNGNDQSLKNILNVGIDAYRQGIAVSLNVPSGGFDTHGDNEQGQIAALYNLFDAIQTILVETETPTNGKAAVPCVIVVSSDFGRSPYYRNGGTDHWPVTSMMVVQNALAKKMNFAIPTNTVIGASTPGDETQALRSMKVDPKTLKVDSNGVTMTPGHIMRALRRLAGIEGSPKLAAYPLTVDKDLAIG